MTITIEYTSRRHIQSVWGDPRDMDKCAVVAIDNLEVAVFWECTSEPSFKRHDYAAQAQSFKDKLMQNATLDVKIFFDLIKNEASQV